MKYRRSAKTDPALQVLRESEDTDHGADCKECQIGLVAYTITHHTRQSAIGLPFISKHTFDGKEQAVTEYTMRARSWHPFYEKIENRLKRRESFLSMRSTVFPRPWLRRCCSFYSVRPLETIRYRTAG